MIVPDLVVLILGELEPLLVGGKSASRTHRDLALLAGSGPVLEGARVSSIGARTTGTFRLKQIQLKHATSLRWYYLADGEHGD